MRYEAEKVFIVFKQKTIIDSVWSLMETAQARLKEVNEDEDEKAYVRTFLLDSTEGWAMSDSVQTVKHLCSEKGCFCWYAQISGACGVSGCINQEWKEDGINFARGDDRWENGLFVRYAMKWAKIVDLRVS